MHDKLEYRKHRKEGGDHWYSACIKSAKLQRYYASQRWTVIRRCSWNCRKDIYGSAIEQKGRWFEYDAVCGLMRITYISCTHKNKSKTAIKSLLSLMNYLTTYKNIFSYKMNWRMNGKNSLVIVIKWNCLENNLWKNYVAKYSVMQN